MNLKLPEILSKMRNRSYWAIMALWVSAVLLCLFGYLPLRGKVNRLVIDLKNLELSRDHMQAIIGSGKDFEAGKKELQVKLEKLQARFPDKEYDPLNRISEMARMSGLAVVSVNSDPKHLIEDPEAQGLRIDGQVCHQIAVSMDLRGSFSSLIGYLTALKESPNTFTMVKSYRIRKENPESKTLVISLEMNLYLLL